MMQVNKHIRARTRIAIILSSLLMAATLCGAAAQPEQESIPFKEPSGLLSHIADSFIDQTACVGDIAFRLYSNLRIEELDPSVLVNADPISFGPWTALPDHHAPSAPDDGSIAEWEDAYFITHDWSDYGKDILSMLPGDELTINGRHVYIERVFNYPKESYAEELFEIWGTDGVILQTCLPGRDMNRIVCAR